MFARQRRAQRGVALIVTIIMLSVITFLAVAFLALMGREKGSVKIATDQTIARLASDTARERAQAELLATILATTNLASFDLLVSTNFVRWEGFDSAVTPATGDPRTNVNYDYQSVSPYPALTPDQALQNLASLFYNPRPPVFITNRLTGANEFRFFNDLNRNGRPDRTGFWPETNAAGLPITSLSNSILVTNFSYVIGDPEWLGGLERADLPHSPSNRFAYRYSYLVVPAGKTLDLNYIHNQTRRVGPTGPTIEGFRRNQGVGSSEINLAALLVDLNTNIWPGPETALLGRYNYETNNPAQANGGYAFNDALSLLLYRYAGNFNNLVSPRPLVDVGNIDEYGNGGPTGFPMQTFEWANDFNDTGIGYPGADNPNHYFSAQDLFNTSKTANTPPIPGADFSARLAVAGVRTNTYDQYTYYRLLSQLGTDSAPEDPDKLNLNYVNVGGLSATNFIPWTDDASIKARFGVPGSVLFFSNVVDRLLKAYTAEWLATDYDYFTNRFQVTQAFRLASETNFTHIPVFVNGRMVYSPAVHRVLQLAANIWDAKTNQQDRFGPLPTVFRPYFTNINGNVFISHFGEIQRTNELPSRLPWDLTATTNLPVTFVADDLIYGVPLVVGARSGLPNFDECAMESIFTITRKIELVKSAPGGQGQITQTNQFFTMNVSVASGAEFWNSYRSNYTRPVDILVNNRITLALTNDNNVRVVKTVLVSGSLQTNVWSGWKGADHNDRSFMVSLRTNVSLFFPSTQAYLPGSGRFVDPDLSVYEVDSRLLFPRWNLFVTNRVQAMILDSATKEIVDYVLLGDMNSSFDLAAEIGQDGTAVDPTNPFKGLWVTNAIGNLLSGRSGIIQQILASRGNFGNLQSSDWIDEGSFTGNRAAEIAKFKAFFTPNHLATYTENGVNYTGSNGTLRAYAPFIPSVTFTMPMSWQANDPLVHYIARDMFYAEESVPPNPPNRIKPAGNTNYAVMKDIGAKNKRYKPWPSDPTTTEPDAFNLTMKDPLMTSSDEWQFQTNALPTIGWLGRIHRGTPWQTIYLKASDLGLQPQTYTTNLNSSSTWIGSYAIFANKWARWTGNADLREGFLTRPITDRVLFDEFTTAFDENSTRGQLSINQTGLAAWSAVLSGVVALTNTSTSRPLFSPLVVQPAGYYDALNPNTWPPMAKIVAGINRTRANTNLFPTGTFEHLGDILAVPELSVGANPALDGTVDIVNQTFQGNLYWTNVSPYLYLGEPVLNVSRKLEAAMSEATPTQKAGLNDAAVEWLPQQIMSLLRRGEPRFVIYAYGQALHPAANSVLTSGPYFQMCTNYQITAEVATRAVVRVEGSPDPRNANHPDVKKRYPPRLVVESFNYLPPD